MLFVAQTSRTQSSESQLSTEQAARASVMFIVELVHRSSGEVAHGSGSVTVHGFSVCTRQGKQEICQEGTKEAREKECREGTNEARVRGVAAAHHDEGIVRARIVRRAGVQVRRRRHAVLEVPELEGALLAADGLDVSARRKHVAPRMVAVDAVAPGAVGEVLSADEAAVDLAALVEGVAHAAPLGARVGVVDVVGAKVPAGLRGEELGAACRWWEGGTPL